MASVDYLSCIDRNYAEPVYMYMRSHHDVVALVLARAKHGAKDGYDVFTRGSHRLAVALCVGAARLI